MSNSPTLGKLFERIAKAQTRLKAALADSTNPHFKSQYADLAAVEEALRCFAEEGVARLQLVSSAEDGSVRVTTILGCPEGEFIQMDATMKPDRPGPHAFGSAVTYLRRYAMAAACCLSQSDDDANAATNVPGRQPPAQAPIGSQLESPAPAVDKPADATSLRVLTTWMSKVLGKPSTEDRQKWLDWIESRSGLKVSALAELPQSSVEKLVAVARQEVAAAEDAARAA